MTKEEQQAYFAKREQERDLRDRVAEVSTALP